MAREPQAWQTLSMSPWLLCLACACCVALLVGSTRTGWRPGVVVGKLGAAACFVGLALSFGALENRYGQIMLVGLVLCASGDALLLPEGQTTWFQAGIGAFLLGHLAYAVAFLSGDVDPLAALLAGAGMIAVAIATLRWLRPHLPADFRAPVIAYVSVIGVMVTLAVGASSAGAPTTVALGAIGFAASDLSVARDRFVAPGFVNGAWGLPLYFGSQLLLASTIASLG